MLRISLWFLIRNISFAFQEQELYQKEGLGVNEVHYVDNQDCIGMKNHSSLCTRDGAFRAAPVGRLLYLLY